MFDIGWTEMLMIAVLALIIIGPKDLPGTLRTVGQWVRKARSLAREFQSGIDEMVREAELDDARKALEATKRSNLSKTIKETVDPGGELSDEAKALEETARESDRAARAAPAKTASEPETATTQKAEAPEAQEPAGSAAGQEAPEEAKARVVKHPASPAPGNSVRPPREAEGATKGTAGEAQSVGAEDDAKAANKAGGSAG